MLVTSKDVFWIVLSIVILWIGVFTGLSAYYVAMMLRDMQKLTKSMRKKMEIVDEILNSIKKKVESTASYIPPLVEGAIKLTKAFRGNKSEESRSKKKK